MKINKNKLLICFFILITHILVGYIFMLDHLHYNNTFFTGGDDATYFRESQTLFNNLSYFDILTYQPAYYLINYAVGLITPNDTMRYCAIILANIFIVIIGAWYLYDFLKKFMNLNTKTSLVFVILYSLLPIHFVYSALNFKDGLIATLMIMAIYYAFETVQSKEIRPFKALLITLLILFFTRFQLAVIMFPILLYVVKKRSPSKSFKLRNSFYLYLLGFTVIIILGIFIAKYSWYFQSIIAHKQDFRLNEMSQGSFTRVVALLPFPLNVMAMTMVSIILPIPPNTYFEKPLIFCLFRDINSWIWYLLAPFFLIYSLSYKTRNEFEKKTILITWLVLLILNLSNACEERYRFPIFQFMFIFSLYGLFFLKKYKKHLFIILFFGVIPFLFSVVRIYQVYFLK